MKSMKRVIPPGHLGTHVKPRWWLSAYVRIARALGLNPIADLVAAMILAILSMFKGVRHEGLEGMLRGRVVVVVGAGPSVEDDLKVLDDMGILESSVMMAADDAALAVLRLGLMPHVVVTDLDGDPNVLLTTSRAGALLVVLAHGDNVASVIRLVPRVRTLLPTGQVLPLPGVDVYGGFTDGDRAVYLAVYGGARTIILAGMGLKGPIGAYSRKKKGTDWERRKRAKLVIARVLLESLASSDDGREVILLDVTDRGGGIAGFERLRPGSKSLSVGNR